MKKGSGSALRGVQKTRHETAGPQDSLKCTGAEEMRGHVTAVEALCVCNFGDEYRQLRHLCEAIHLIALPLSIVIPNRVELSTFSTSSTSNFRLLSSSPENSATYDLCQLARVLPYRPARTYARERDAMSRFLYSSASGASGTRVLRYRKDSDCWTPCAMACGWRTADRRYCHDNGPQ